MLFSAIPRIPLFWGRLPLLQKTQRSLWPTERPVFYCVLASIVQGTQFNSINTLSYSKVYASLYWIDSMLPNVTEHTKPIISVGLECEACTCLLICLFSLFERLNPYAGDADRIFSAHQQSNEDLKESLHIFGTDQFPSVSKLSCKIFGLLPVLNGISTSVCYLITNSSL